jgi:NAD(P)-dependent dehydrogenase (short-subunit alcohol dehydrogenase family)
MARKAIFITGGGSGIGRAVARHFAGQGWFVGIADVNSAGIDETAALLPDGASSRHVMDVRDRDQWKAALDAFSGRAAAASTCCSTMPASAPAASSPTCPPPRPTG